jgi:hypothetical protein
MTASELDAMANRWERQNAASAPPRRTALQTRLDCAFDRWKAESPAGCLTCLLEELD